MDIREVYNTLNDTSSNIECIVQDIDNYFQDILDNIDEIIPIDEKKYSTLYNKIRKVQGDLTSILENNFPNINL